MIQADVSNRPDAPDLRRLLRLDNETVGRGLVITKQITIFLIIAFPPVILRLTPFSSLLCNYQKHLIRPRQHVWRNRQADLLGRFQIDDELEFYWLLHG